MNAFQYATTSLCSCPSTYIPFLFFVYRQFNFFNQCCAVRKLIVRVQPGVKWVPKYRGNGCRSAGKRDKRIPRSILGSQIHAGQRAWLQPGGCTLMGCRCPISDGQGWAKAQPGRARNRTKKETRWGQDYLILWLKSPIYYRGLYIVIDKQ